MYGMYCLNCALTGSKKAKPSSKEASDDDDDDDDDDEADIPLPVIDVKRTTQEFYEQLKQKVLLSFSYTVFFYTSSYRPAVCHISSDIWYVKYGLYLFASMLSCRFSDFLEISLCSNKLN